MGPAWRRAALQPSGRDKAVERTPAFAQATPPALGVLLTTVARGRGSPREDGQRRREALNSAPCVPSGARPRQVSTFERLHPEEGAPWAPGPWRVWLCVPRLTLRVSKGDRTA